MAEDEGGKSSGMKTSLIIKGLLVLSLVANAGLVSLYIKTNEELKSLQANPQQASDAEVSEVVAEVSKLIALPPGVTPTLATVSDAAALKQRQPFFSAAEDGDKVLLYANAPNAADRKAYLYRPSSKQLLNVAPISIGNQVQAQDDAFSMAIRNGTSTEGLEQRMENLLAQVFPNATVPDSGVASRSDYQESVLVQVNADDELAQKVAQLFNVQLVGLPDGEDDPGDVDLVLILGGAASDEAAPAAESGAEGSGQEQEAQLTVTPVPDGQ